MRKPRKPILSYIAFPLFLALILFLILLFREDLVRLFRDREALRLWIRARGAYGMLAFMGLQALQVVLFIIPGDIVQLAGGYAYGFWRGIGLSLAGITVGAVFNFAIGRALGRPFVEAIFKKDRVEAIERVTSSGRAAAGFFLLFVIPGLPKDALCYIAGISRLGFPLFMAISMVGRLPGIMGSTFMGSAAYQERYGAALFMLALASVLFFLGLAFKEKIEAFLVGLLRRGKKEEAKRKEALGRNEEEEGL